MIPFDNPLHPQNQPILLPLFLQDIAALRIEFPFGRVAWHQFLWWGTGRRNSLCAKILALGHGAGYYFAF